MKLDTGIQTWDFSVEVLIPNSIKILITIEIEARLVTLTVTYNMFFHNKHRIYLCPFLQGYKYKYNNISRL